VSAQDLQGLALTQPRATFTEHTRRALLLQRRGASLEADGDAAQPPSLCLWESANLGLARRHWTEAPS